MATGGCDEDYPSEGRYVFGLFYGFLSLLIIASNIINLITLPHARASLGANTVLSFQALALVDLLTGIFVTGRNFLEVFCPYISGPSIQATVKRVSTILSVMCMNWSMLILGCVSANRYLVIAKPVTYGIYMTRGKMLASLLVVCLLGAVHAIGGNILSYSQTNPPCYYHVEFCEGISPSFLALYLVVPVLVTVVITFTNIKLLFIVVDHKKRLRRQSMIDMKRCDANPKCESIFYPTSSFMKRPPDLETTRESKSTKETKNVIASYSRKPVRIKFPSCWEFMDFKQRRENLIDKYSIYNDQTRTLGLPVPGQRAGITRELADSGWREERGYIKRVTGFPLSACVSGLRNENHRRARNLSPIRLPTANTICDEYHWMHDGLHGKMLLSNKKYRHILASEEDNHDLSNKLHYCEVLGQRVCSDCIEHTNRTMAIEYQHEAFPEIEVSASRLVAPKLSKLLHLKTASNEKEAKDHKSKESHDKQQKTTGMDILGDRGSPPPYRQPSALRNQRRVTIYKDSMINSLRQTLKRDRMMTAETLQDTREMRLKKGKRPTLRQMSLHKLREIEDI
ncbi:uncharacterized protein [Diadema antillarum]|uniref:uncharacterized protein n=1 Tax=Diadema antillarum TaxID=105358 RepID=UPI003A895025